MIWWWLWTHVQVVIHAEYEKTPGALECDLETSRTLAVMKSQIWLIRGLFVAHFYTYRNFVNLVRGRWKERCIPFPIQSQGSFEVIPPEVINCHSLLGVRDFQAVGTFSWQKTNSDPRLRSCSKSTVVWCNAFVEDSIFLTIAFFLTKNQHQS